MGFKIVMVYPDGEREQDDDEVFDTYAEADAYGLEQVSNYRAGGEVLHLSNPGDYPEHGDDDDADYEVIEVAD